jgi:hypothetical protein
MRIRTAAGRRGACRRGFSPCRPRDGQPAPCMHPTGRGTSPPSTGRGGSSTCSTSWSGRYSSRSNSPVVPSRRPATRGSRSSFRSATPHPSERIDDVDDTERAARASVEPMRYDVHLHGLRAAAHVALAIPLLSSCTRSRATESRALSEPSDVSTGDSLPRVTPGDTPVASSSAVECQVLLKETFREPSAYPGQKRDVSPRVQTCCAELLVVSEADEHRWDCCANTPQRDTDPQVRLACTPWGPPVPPAMHRSSGGVA